MDSYERFKRRLITIGIIIVILVIVFKFTYLPEKLLLSFGAQDDFRSIHLGGVTFWDEHIDPTVELHLDFDYAEYDAEDGNYEQYKNGIYYFRIPKEVQADNGKLRLIITGRSYNLSDDVKLYINQNIIGTIDDGRIEGGLSDWLFSDGVLYERHFRFDKEDYKIQFNKTHLIDITSGTHSDKKKVVFLKDDLSYKDSNYLY